MKRYVRRIYAEYDYEIKLPDGRITHLVSGTSISKVLQIAGNGCHKPIGDIDRIVAMYGGKRHDWKKMRGEGIIDIDGIRVRVELHWYQLNKYRYEMKVKKIF